jgi:hypothetical protein
MSTFYAYLGIGPIVVFTPASIGEVNDTAKSAKFRTRYSSSYFLAKN